MWFNDDIEKIVQAIILANPNPDFRAGVATLAHALGAKRVQIMTGVTLRSVVDNAPCREETR